MANVTLTNITPPRVPLTDARTGLIAREWYLFFLNLFTLVGAGQNTTSISDLLVGPPPAEPITTSPNEPNGFTMQGSSLESQVAELNKRVEALEKLPAQIEAMLSQLADVNALSPSDGDKLIYNGSVGKWQQDSRSYLMLE